MAINQVQHQKGLLMTQFMTQYATATKCQRVRLVALAEAVSMPGERKRSWQGGN